MHWFAALILALIGLKLLVQMLLEHFNRLEVLRHAGSVPNAFKGAMDDGTYRKATEYTLAKSRFNRWELIVDTAVLVALLFSGILPWAFSIWAVLPGLSAWSLAGYLFAVGLII